MGPVRDPGGPIAMTLHPSRLNVIVLAESRAVRDGGLRPIRDGGGTPRTHVTAGESQGLASEDLEASRCGRILWLL
jgi:hypothetical protein